MDTLRAAVRPVLTLGFGAALIAASFLDAGAFDLLREPGLLLIGWYVGSRSKSEANER